MLTRLLKKNAHPVVKKILTRLFRFSKCRDGNTKNPNAHPVVKKKCSPGCSDFPNRGTAIQKLQMLTRLLKKNAHPVVKKNAHPVVKKNAHPVVQIFQIEGQQYKNSKCSPG